TFQTINIERLKVEAYRPPTEADKAALEATIKAEKAAAPKVFTPPLINPTDEDAERLVAQWNEVRRADFEKRHGAGSQYYKFELCEVRKMPQAFYSANSKGS